MDDSKISSKVIPEKTEFEETEQDIDAEDEEASLDHFESTYTLKAKEKYDANQYRYETDRHGRISHCEGTLRLEPGKTNITHQQKAGGPDRLDDDDGGHIIARRFNGSEKIDNIVPMNFHLNRSEYKALENEWAKDIEEGKTVDVSIDCKYGWGDSERPKEIRVKYIVSDEYGEIERKVRSFTNYKEARM